MINSDKEIVIDIVDNGEFTETKVTDFGRIGYADYVRAAMSLVYRAADEGGCRASDIITALAALDKSAQKQPDALRDFAEAVRRQAENY